MKLITPVIICPVYYPYAGGGRQYFPLLALKMAKWKDVRQIFVVTERHASFPLIEKQDGVCVIRSLFRRDTLGKRSYIWHAATFVANYIIIFFVLLYLLLFCNVRVVHLTRYLTHSMFLLVGFLSSLKKLRLLSI